MDEMLKQLRDRLEELQSYSAAIYDALEAEKRSETDEESKELGERALEFSKVTAQITRREEFLAQKASLTVVGENRQTPADKPNNGEPTGTREEPTSFEQRRIIPATARNAVAEARHGYHTMGHFAQSVRNANPRCGGHIDDRLRKFAPTTVGAEGTGADGGFAVPPDFQTAIMDRISGEDSLLSRTDQLVSSSNQITVPIDETTAWQTSGGLLTYWEGENQQMNQSKPQLRQTTVKLNKLTALVPVTDELIEDAPAMETYLKRKVPQKFDFALNLAFVQGNGVGKPLGILNSPATISVAKEGSQTADTVNYQNILKMYNRMYAPYRSGAVWLVNQDVEPQLHQLLFSGSLTDIPVWLPAGGISGAPFATIFGRPIIPTQACETLGDKGDILFVNLGEYMTVTKPGGMRADTSIHLWFDYDTTAFRFIMRVAGKPWLSTPIAARDGSTTYSAFVTLAERG